MICLARDGENGDNGFMTLNSTALESVHERLGATMTDFAGWNMPLRYSSDREEHTAVRERAGMFDLSHMGQIRVEGPDAGKLLDYAFVNILSTIEVGRARYSLMVDERGGVLDDVIVYRTDDIDFLVIANGVNRLRVVGELTKRSEAIAARVAVQDNTTARTLIAIQGPASLDIVASVVDRPDDLQALGYYRHGLFTIDEAPVHIARTGYTGERGYEIMADANGATRLWEALTAAGEPFGMVPCGLSARDTLRLEAGMPLYGNELSADRTPAAVGQGRVVKLDHDFVGADALREAGDPPTALYGLIGEGRRAARAGSAVSVDGQEVGVITSGVLSPTLGYPIALALLTPGLDDGQTVSVDVRGKAQPMTISQLPFYKSSN